MRICVDKTTGKIIEMQGLAKPGQLIDNAYALGLDVNFLEEREITETEYAEIMTNQPKTAQQTIAALEAAVDAFMDGKAQTKGFRDRHSFALRAGIPGSSWHAQALVFGAWMDSVNDYCWQVKVDCLAGTREVPTIETLLAELPVLEGE